METLVSPSSSGVAAGPGLVPGAGLPAPARGRALPAAPPRPGSCAPTSLHCHIVTLHCGQTHRHAVCTCAGSCQSDGGAVQRGLRLEGSTGGPQGRRNLRRSPAMADTPVFSGRILRPETQVLVCGTGSRWHRRRGRTSELLLGRLSGPRGRRRPSKRGPAATTTRGRR